MNIIIPMTGYGSRFKKAGYLEYKPFIHVTENKVVLDFVIDSFSNDDEYYFIVRESTKHDLKNYLAKKSLKTHIITINDNDFVKNGPVGTILAVKDSLKDIQGQVIVSYCDYGVEWNYQEFLNRVNDENIYGYVPCYSGVHPHLLNEKNVYAACKVDNNGLISAVIEKYNSQDRFNELWSPGIYYFKNVNILFDGATKLLKTNSTINGEFYVSLVYNHITNCYASNCIDKFYQLGTPEDLEFVKKCLNLNFKNNLTDMNKVILAAGRGERFFNMNYKIPKPFLPVNDEPLFKLIKKSLNNDNIKIVASLDHKKFWSMYDEDITYVPSNKIGASFSYYDAMKNLTGPVLITPCDLLCNFNLAELNKYKNDYDAIIFTCDPTEYQCENVKSFSWVNDEILSIKNRESEDQKVLIGSFYINDNQKLIDAIRTQFSKDDRVNNEFYLDSAFKYLTFKCINVNDYLSFGTPDEYKTALSIMYYENRL